MAVEFYDKGQHPTGFYGFKAYDDMRHHYYAIGHYSYEEAKMQAISRSNDYEYYTIARQQDLGTIVDGLRCQVDRRSGAGFCVDVPGRIWSREIVSISEYGYTEAWRRACIKFCAVHCRDIEYCRWLIKRKPNKSVFNTLCFRRNMRQVRIE